MELIDALLDSMLDLKVRVDSEGAAMVIWALWRTGRFHDAWTLFVRTLSDGRHPEHGKTGFNKRHAVDGRQRYYQTLLMEAERRGDVAKQVFLWQLVRTRLGNGVSWRLAARLGLREEDVEPAAI